MKQNTTKESLKNNMTNTAISPLRSQAALNDICFYKYPACVHGVSVDLGHSVMPSVWSKRGFERSHTPTQVLGATEAD